MDLFVTLFYGVICGALSLIAPSFRTRPLRFGAGVAIGILSALLMPTIRGLMGF